MTFNVAAAEPEPTVDADRPDRPHRRLERPERLKQIGARVKETTYRQLKARAALTGATVQELAEQAIAEFLAKPE